MYTASSRFSSSMAFLTTGSYVTQSGHQEIPVVASLSPLNMQYLVLFFSSGEFIWSMNSLYPWTTIFCTIFFVLL